MLLKILYTLIVVVAGLHAYFMYKEMFDWIAFSGEVAGLTENIAKATIPLGKNQGLYNGFLAAGLVWSLFAAASYKKQLMLFFLLCVLVAGLVGGFTIMPPNKAILISQALSATITLIVLFFVWRGRGTQAA